VRTFWILIALLTVAAGAALWFNQRERPSADAIAMPTDGAATPTGLPEPVSEETLAPERDEPHVHAESRHAEPGHGDGRHGDGRHAGEHEPRTDPLVDDSGSPIPTQDQLVAELLASASERLGRSAEGSAGAGGLIDDEGGEELTVGLDMDLDGATVRPGRIVRRADGSIVADRRFTISGSGAARDPYRISWDLLISASETFQPRLGELEIPQRVAMLHGKHVRIEGYAAFPSASFDPREMLMMLNQWDGCCIGVPPTPFDAIEVQLSAAPAQRRPQTSYYGTVTGLLLVEPFLIDSWLVGLYLMDEASVNLGL